MPVPEGVITTSNIWKGEPVDVPLPEEPEDDEDKRQEIALKIHKGEL